jgi:hypothetical protein
MDNKVETLKAALIEVRKAFRLVESFQERMLSLVNFIATRLDFHQMEGVKHFSNPLYSYRDGTHLKVNPRNWAWDFIYPYLFEYYVGAMDLDDGSTINLSIIQYADTGFFENDNEDRTSLDAFASAEESGSKLLFFMERQPKGCKELWQDYSYTANFVLNKEYSSINHTETVLLPKGAGKNQLLLYSIPLERFSDERSTTIALNEYLSFLGRNGIELFLV